MIAFYIVCLVSVFSSFILTAFGAVKPDRLTTCLFQLGIIFMIVADLMAEITK